MLRPLTFPDIGTEAAPIRMAGWLVDSGENVAVGDRLVEVLSQGVVFEVGSPWNGQLKKIERRPPAEIHVGDILAWIEAEDD